MNEILKECNRIMNLKNEELPTNEEIYKYLEKFDMAHLLPLKVLDKVRSLIENNLKYQKRKDVIKIERNA